jgi:hypothetical protein
MLDGNGIKKLKKGHVLKPLSTGLPFRRGQVPLTRKPAHIIMK